MGTHDEDHGKRHRQRQLFNSVAEQYDACRPGYPRELVGTMVTVAGLQPGSRVLEVGCGTGQLTRQLAGNGFGLTAIDMGPSMIDIAQRHVPGQAAEFHLGSFEDYRAPDHTFGLVVAATSFHWVDPEVAWVKAAQLLVAGGWLAVLGTTERYDDPFGAALREAWVRRSDDDGAWTKATPPRVAEAMTASGLFGTPVVRAHSERRSMPAATVLGLELTRAASLSYDGPARESFRAELAAVLQDSPQIGLEQWSSLTMGQTPRT